MKYGFYNNVTYDAAAKKPNEILGKATSLGHVTSAQTGFHRYVSRMNGGSTNSVANNSEVPIGWNNNLEDTMAMHSETVNSERITVPIPGLYRVRARVVFAANATGLRRANIRLDGTVKIEDTVIPSASAQTAINLDVLVDVPSGVAGVLQVNAFQTSGGALNVDRSVGYFEAELIRPA
jgi:hypothetical protein